MKESRRFYPNKELARTSARLCRPRQRRPRAASKRPTTRSFAAAKARCSCRPTRGASAFSRARARADHRRLARADHRRAAAVHRRARAARGRRGEARRRRQRRRHGSAHRRDAGDGQLADVQPERLQRGDRDRAAQSRGAGHLRAGLDVQGRHGRGGARRERDAADAFIDTNPGVIRFGGSVVDEFDGHNYGVLSLTDVIVKSSNVGAIKIGLQGRRRAAGPLRQPLRVRPADLARLSRARARASSGARRS